MRSNIRNRLGSIKRNIDLCFKIRSTTGLGFSQYLWVKDRREGRLHESQGLDAHLKLALEWLCRAQDVSGVGGVSGSFNQQRKGWQVDYPETSGYILSTFLIAARMNYGDEYRERAERIAAWEVDIQAPNGGVFTDENHPHTRVFNTGQVLLGWLDYLELTDDSRVLTAAARAGDYLCSIQEGDGSWVKDTHCGARTYETRVDWALLRLYMVTGERRYLEIAFRNLCWVIKNQDSQTGWFEKCGFHDDLPITHVIAYSLRGLIECGSLGLSELDELSLLGRADLGLRKLRESVLNRPLNGIPGMVPTAFDREWKSGSKDSCVTGNAQLAICYYRLGEILNQNEYLEFGDQLTDCLMKIQITGSPLKEIEGAIPGSYPFHHGYMSLRYPNWAAKFFADALFKRKYGQLLKLRS